MVRKNRKTIVQINELQYTFSRINNHFIREGHMKIKAMKKELLQYLEFAFYPATTLIACTAISAVVIAILVITMLTTPQNSILYNIVFTLTTGAAASFFVSVIVEMASNFKRNKLAWYELEEYHKTLLDYEMNKQILMQLTPHQRAEKKAHEEFVAAGGIEEIDEDDKPKDIIQIIWNELPTIIPVFKQTLNEKKEFLSDIEIDELKVILSEYESIRVAIKEKILLSLMTYDALNHPDEEYLKSIYPANIIKHMPDWIRKHLSTEESKKACELYVDTILSDSMLLFSFMGDYDISETGLSNYQTEPDERKKESKDIDYDELDFYEPEDEEIFRAQNEEFCKQSEIEQRPFVNWLLSLSCQNIANSVDTLEKCLSKTPYYGTMIDHWRDSKNGPIDDFVSKISYEGEKRQLDKRLAKQKASANKD